MRRTLRIEIGVYRATRLLLRSGLGRRTFLANERILGKKDRGLHG